MRVLLSEYLIFAIIFLVVLGFVIWVVALLKPRVLPDPPAETQPSKPMTDFSEQELTDLRATLQEKIRTVRTLERKRELLKHIAAIDRQLQQLQASPPPPSSPSSN